MKRKNVKVNKKTSEQLQKEHDGLQAQLEAYLLVLGADRMLIKEIIIDLKSQMCSHADDNVNSMIVDLINLENAIMFAKEEEEKLQSQPQ